MARTITDRCDACGTEKKETNHWWKILEDDTPTGRTFLIKPCDSEIDGWKIYCGQECIHIALSEYLERQRAKASVV